ncbi:hypothetical protein N7492_003046 [Penicillium capsulatum]|uniref:Cytochrome P450 n=1 Tax=Penicillium capsulatum TaxID=69766 RepID=A0A9W9IQA2_9EURO|nr:hypothetical protein N7492_003046 [Penicillium capsulatum]KAJ6122363.1 hypothetical protein N7512_004828 [Penicillium capsulatum]
MAWLTSLFESPNLTQGVYIGLAVVFASTVWGILADDSRIPVVGKNWWDFSNHKARSRFTEAARELIAEGFSKGTSAFQVMAPTGPLIVLHPKYVDEIKNHPYLDFEQFVRKVTFFHDRIAGFEAFHPGRASGLLVDVIRIKLNQALGYENYIGAIIADTVDSPSEWKPCNFSQQCPLLVARLSTLIFMGERICHDKDWINVAVNYTVDAFLAARELQSWPSFLRPLLHWFLPSMHKVRRHLTVARSIVNGEIERRKSTRQGQLLNDPGNTPDALDWFEEFTRAYSLSFDFAVGQVGLAMAAIHTTSNLLTNVMYDLAAYPEYIQPLREEVRTVIAEDGNLRKTSLLKLKLMDSVMKESQRINPVSMTSLNRVAMREVVLSDGTVIPKGASIAVSAHSNRDESIYHHAGDYDGYRFLQKRRKPGHEHRHQLVTTSNQSYYGFGHGLHACPGRFFAANETKILLTHLLLKYDWTFVRGAGRPQNFEIGNESVTDPTVEMFFRSREPEIDLTALG